MLLYIVIPKGFFPVQDTGLIQGITEAAQIDLLRRDGRPPAGAGRRDPQGPGRRQPVLVHRRRRHQHHAQQRPLPDQPEAAATSAPLSASRDHPPAAAARPPSVAGITLYMQPVQDLTIDATVSRTQYQFVAGRRRPGRARHAGRRSWSTQLPAAAAARATSPATCRTRAWRPTSTSTATPPARFGITPATVDNALYDAFGQRIVSTIFTQSNQYRVILEADPKLQSSLDSLASIYLPSGRRRPGAALRDRHGRGADRRRCRSTTSASSRRPRSPSTSRRAPRSARRSTAIQQAEQRDRHAGQRHRPPSRARRWPSRPR